MGRFCLYFLIFASFSSSLMSSTLDEWAMVNGLSVGQAMTAKSGIMESTLKNPALVSHFKDLHFQSSYGSQFDSDVQTMFLGWGYTLWDDVSLGLSIPIQRISNITQTTDNGGQALAIGSFSDLNLASVLTIGTQSLEDRLWVGMNIGYLHHRILNEYGQGIEVDMGMLYRFERVHIGGSVQRLGGAHRSWTTGAIETLDSRYNLGVYLEPLSNVSVVADMESQKQRPSQTNLGATWGLNSRVNISAGIHDISDQKQLSLGLDLKLSRLMVSYAFSQHDSLGNMQKFSISLF